MLVFQTYVRNDRPKITLFFFFSLTNSALGFLNSIESLDYYQDQLDISEFAKTLAGMENDTDLVEEIKDQYPQYGGGSL